MIESLSIKQARKLVLLSQRLLSAQQKGSALSATLEAIEHLGYIQIDTISVIERAHHHTLWNRNVRYARAHLDQLLSKKSIFEYWAHAAAYLPMKDYQFTLPRKLAFRSGEQNHWYKRDKTLIQSVLARITQEGPLMAKDFECSGSKKGGWGRKPAKQALEYLFMQGELMIPYRSNFHKVYDLTERVLPGYINISIPDSHEYGRFLITRYLRANGIGQAGEITYLLKNVKDRVNAVLHEMVFSGEVVELEVGKRIYYVLPQSLELLSTPLRRSKLKILSPFDNLLIQRKRMLKLFDFDYLLECYVPAPERRYGYFSLPILWNGELVARMDCKAERKKKLLHIQNLVLEPKKINPDAFIDALFLELQRFLRFNRCETLQLHACFPENIRPLLDSAVKNL